MRKNLLKHCVMCMLVVVMIVFDVDLPQANVYVDTADEEEAVTSMVDTADEEEAVTPTVDTADEEEAVAPTVDTADEGEAVASTVDTADEGEAVTPTEAANDEDVQVSTVTETISAPETSAVYESMRRKAAASTSSVSSVALKDENAEKWIDRVVLEDYAIDFYEALENGASDADGMLIDVTKNSKIEKDDNGYKYPIVVIEGKADSKSAVLAEMDDNFTKAGENIAAAFYAFDRDHPEVFWLDGGLQYTYYGSYSKLNYSYKQTVYLYLKDTSCSYDIRATDYQDVDTILADIEERDQQVSNIIAECKSASRYKTIRALNSWLTKNNGYNTIMANKATGTAPDTSWECISALEGKSGTEGPVCEGYARAFKVLCDELNIPCVLVDGQAKSSASDTAGGHMWNYVQMGDGSWYGVDVTWNDPVYSDGSSGNGTEDYLLVGANTVNGNDYSFANSHVVYNMPSSNLSYINGPVLSDEEYTISVILGVEVPQETVVATYGYSLNDAPQLTAQVDLKDGVTATPTYQWYSVDALGDETKISGAVNNSYIVPVGKDAGAYQYVVKATLDDVTIASDMVSVTVKPYVVMAGDLEFVSDENSFTKKYDGTTSSSAQVQIKANTFGNEDAILVEGSATYNDANVLEANSITFKPTEITTGNYRLASTVQISHEGTITKSRPSAPTFPAAEKITSNSITLTAVAGCEYSLQNVDGEWSENRIYTELAEDTTYTFYQRYKETDNTEASDYVSAAFTTSTSDSANNTITFNVSDDMDNNDSDENKSANTGNGGVDTGTTDVLSKGEIITDGKSKAEYKVTSIDGKTPTVSYVRPGNSKITTVSIPKTIRVGGITYSVTAIADNAFKNCKKLKKITIGGNVITIGKNVFNGDKKLKTIVIKTNKLTSKSVSKKSFAGVSSKVTIKVPKSKVKAYTKLFRSRGLSKKVKVKKY